MNEQALVLIGQIRRDLETITEIYAALDRHPLSETADTETVIVVGYYLHNLYNAFETIFQNIATVFENSVDDRERWHAQLLERMRLDVQPLRPAVIDQAAYEALDELRRFRHLFRHAYGIDLDPLRLQLVLHKAQQLRERYPQQLADFVRFVEGLGA